MGTPFVIVWHPLVEETLQVLLGEWEQEVQALPPQCAKEPLADGVGLRALRRRFQDLQSQMAYTLVEGLGENGIAVMDEEPVRVIRYIRFTWLYSTVSLNEASTGSPVDIAVSAVASISRCIDSIAWTQWLN
jgi:hypothetical protein